MADKSSKKREQAKALFLQGVAIAEIARRIGMSRKQVQRWKNDDDWEALREGLPQAETSKRPNVVTFERPRERTTPPPRTPLTIAAGKYDDLEGQLMAIDDMLDLALTEARSPTSAQSYGAALNGFCRLLEQRNKLKPVDDEELLAEVLKRFRSPRELVKRLKEAGWGKGA